MWASPEGEAPWYLGTGRAFPAKTQEVDRNKKNIRVGLSDFPIFLAWTDFLFNSSIPKLEKFNQPEKHQNVPNRNQRNETYETYEALMIKRRPPKLQVHGL